MEYLNNKKVLLVIKPLTFLNNKNVLPVSDIFLTVQGEGLRTGEGSIFLRLMGCNLSCSWCDTKYTWHPDEIGDASFYKTSESILSHMKDLGLADNLVITGGEPLLHAHNAIFKQVVLDAAEVFKSIEIETNGTVSIPDYIIALMKEDKITINFSPKLLSSGISKSTTHTRLPRVLADIRKENLMDKCVIKLVTDSPIADFKEITMLLTSVGDDWGKRTFFMAQGTTKESQSVEILSALARYVDDYALGGVFPREHVIKGYK